MNPRSNVLGHSDVLCAYLFPQGDFLRARNGAFDAIKSAAALALIPLPLRAAPRRRGFSIAVGSALGVRCSEKQQDLCNHPTAKFALRWLFYKCYEFVAVGAVQSSPAEAVLSAMNCRKKVVPGFPAKQ